jgi:hypothetical protein
MPLFLSGALVTCRTSLPTVESPAKGLPGLEALGFDLASSRFEDGFVADSAVVGDLAFLVGMRGMMVLDLSVPTSPRVLAKVATKAPELQF